MDSNHLEYIYYKESYTRETFEGVFAKDQFMKEHFRKETYMSVVNKQDPQCPGNHWVMVYQNKKKTYFIDFTNYDFKCKRPIYQVHRRSQCLDWKLYGAYLVFWDAD